MGKSAKKKGKKVHWRKKSRSSKKKKKRVRPTANKARHARRRHRKRHPASRVSSHKRLFEEAETANYLLHQLLKTTSADPLKPYHYHPRHHTKDLEYKTSNARMRAFKRGVPAPDVQMWRPPPYETGPYTAPAL